MQMPHPSRLARVSSWVCRSDPVSDTADPSEIIVHATCVAHSGRAVLIRGAAGRGKSGLGLHLLALGADLVADDRTRLWRDGAQVLATAPEAIAGQIEARGMGILHLPRVTAQPLALIVDMDNEEAERLPPLRHEVIFGLDIPSVRKSAFPHLAAALLLYLKHGKLA